MDTQEKLLNDMLDYARSADDGDLIVGWRLRLWSVMKRDFPESASFRRGVLGYLVQRQTNPLWHRGEFPGELAKIWREYPDQSLAELRRYLLGESSLDALRKWHRNCNLSLHVNPADIFGNDAARLFAYETAAKAWYEAWGGCDDFYDEWGWYETVWEDDAHLRMIDQPEADWWDLTDAHSAAAMAISGGPTWNEGCNPELRRAFWLSWINDNVRAVLQPEDQVMDLLLA